MFKTAFALSLTQFARTLSIPERLQRRPARNATLEPWRLRNTGLDALYYDVKSLTAEETFYISDSLGSEGLIMIVPPSGGDMLTICDSVAEYKLRGGSDVHALAIAGIGGSAIGAAAFARNVADAIGEPVAAVVSGYGLGDIINETIGGSFFFGWLGHMRNDLEVIDDVVGRPHLGAYEDRHKLALKARPSALDTDTVETLLADSSLSFHLLAGHSRGNRVLSEALYAIREEDRRRLRELAGGLRIVTFGGRITMPPDCREVVDVIGELDWFGEINSRPQIDSDIRVPLAGHSTNTDLAGALQVTKILKGIIARSLPVVTEQAETAAPVATIAEDAAVSPIPELEAEAAPEVEIATPAVVAEAAPETLEADAPVKLKQPPVAETMQVEAEAVIVEAAAPDVAAKKEKPIASPVTMVADKPVATAPEIEAPPAAPVAQRHPARKSKSVSHRASKPKGTTRR